MNWNNWLKGLGVAVAGAATVSAANVVNNRLQNGKTAPPITGPSVGISAAAGAMVAFLSYLVQSPIPASTDQTSPAK